MPARSSPTAPRRTCSPRWRAGRSRPCRRDGAGVTDTKETTPRDPPARDPKAYQPKELPTAIPPALIAATDHLTRLADRSEPIARRITGALDRLSGAPRAPEPPEFDRPPPPPAAQ